MPELFCMLATTQMRIYIMLDNRCRISYWRTITNYIAETFCTWMIRFGGRTGRYREIRGVSVARFLVQDVRYISLLFFWSYVIKIYLDVLTGRKYQSGNNINNKTWVPFGWKMRDDYKKWGMITKKCGMITARKNAGWLQINQYTLNHVIKTQKFRREEISAKIFAKKFSAEFFSADFIQYISSNVVKYCQFSIIKYTLASGIVSRGME